jgi:hypothetical protein
MNSNLNYTFETIASFSPVYTAESTTAPTFPSFAAYSAAAAPSESTTEAELQAAVDGLPPTPEVFEFALEHWNTAQALYQRYGQKSKDGNEEPPMHPQLVAFRAKKAQEEEEKAQAFKALTNRCDAVVATAEQQRNTAITALRHEASTTITALHHEASAVVAAANTARDSSITARDNAVADAATANN